MLLGICWGINPKTGASAVALPAGRPVGRVCTVIRRPESKVLNAQEILQIKATPKRPNPLNDEQQEPTSVNETKGQDRGGEGSKLERTPVQETSTVNIRISASPMRCLRNSVTL